MRHLAVLGCLCLSFAATAASLPPAAPASAAPPPASARKAAQADSDGNRIADGLQARLAQARDGDPVRVVVTFRGDGDAASARRAVGLFQVHHEFRVIRGFSATMTVGQVIALARQPEVLRIEEDFPVSIKLDAARSDFGADAARAAHAVSGAGIKGCIVDTGVDPGHEQLNSQLIPFFDAINGRTTAYDDQGHGTHVASIAFGDGSGGAGADRYRGVAPGVAIHAAKVLDANGSGLESQVIAGIDWCVSQGVHLISMSLGSDAASDGNDALSLAANAAVASNVVVVVAAGNSGDAPGSVGSPGAAAQAITVAACAERSAAPGAPNHSDGIYLAPFSSRGPTLDNRTKPDICAPGHSITAAQAGTVAGYVTYSGTSMATPFVAGAVALALQARTMPPAELRQLLEASAQDRGPASKDNDFGAGLLDVNAFVARAKGVANPPSTAFPTYRRIAGSVATHGLWSHSFALGAADLGIPIGAMLTIDGQVKCSLELFGLCFSAQWDPDLEARLLDPNGVLLSQSTCLAGSECGLMGRQETLHAMPTVAGTYTIQVFPAEDSGNMGKGGTFALDLSTGPVGAPTAGPAAHVGGLESTATGNKTGWQARVTITLHDGNHLALTLPAVVTGTWSGGFSGSSSCSTSTGQCIVTSGTIPKRKTTATFTVTNVSGEFAYQPGSNHPASITVVKP